jgi:hypothetical protein
LITPKITIPLAGNNVKGDGIVTKKVHYECFLMYLPIIKREIPISSIDMLIIN